MDPVSEPEDLVIDTHVVIWWVTDHPRLSETAARRMQEAIDAKRPLFVSAYSLLELRYASEKPETRRGHIAPDLHDAIVAEVTGEGSVFKVVDMTAPIVARLGTGALARDKGPNDPGDRIILATALELDAALVTKDDLLHDEDGVRIVW